MTYGTECKVVATLAMMMTLVGCAHQPPRVDCDGKLQPINQPAPVQHKDTDRPPFNPPDAKQSEETAPLGRGAINPGSSTTSPSGKEKSL